MANEGGIKEVLQKEEAWGYDDQMRVAFSPLPPKDVGPERRAQRVAFWLNIFLKCAIATSNGRISRAGLSDQFGRKFADGRLVPVCLDDVLDDLYLTKKVESRSEFRSKAAPKILQPGKKWTLGSLVMKSAQWSLSTSASAVSYLVWGSSLPSKKEDLVLLPAMEQLASEFAKQHASGSLKEAFKQAGSLEDFNGATLMTLEKFIDSLQGSVVGDVDQSLLAEYLIRTQCISAFFLSPFDPSTSWEPSKVGIKIPPRIVPENPPQLTDVDSGAIHIQNTIANQERQILKLENEIEQTTKKIQQTLAANRRPQALVLLKKKKGLDKVLFQRTDALHKLEQISMEIQSATSNKALVDAYQNGAESLSRFTKENKLGVEQVESVMDHLEDVLADQKEIEDAISRPIWDFEDDEVESEYQELLQDVEADKVAKELAKLSLAPSPPKEKEKEEESDEEKNQPQKQQQPQLLEQ